MTSRSLVLLACFCATAPALADDISELPGKWHVDQLVTHGVDRHVTPRVTVTFDVTLDEPNNYFLVRGDV